MTAREFIRATRKKNLTPAQSFWRSRIALALHTNNTAWLTEALAAFERVK